MTIDYNTIIADEGKVFRRIKDQLVVGPKVVLGYTYMMYGAKLDSPILERPADYEEIEKPIKQS